MAGVREHKCENVSREATICGNCGRAWCDACDPAHGPLCPWCNGRGYSTAPIPPRQALKLFH